jgi:hypothetical protein
MTPACMLGISSSGAGNMKNKLNVVLLVVILIMLAVSLAQYVHVQTYNGLNAGIVVDVRGFCIGYETRGVVGFFTGCG